MNKAIDFFLGQNLSGFLKIIESGGTESMAMIKGLSEQTYHIGDLGIDRNTFTYWLKKGLIPYQSESSSGWRTFSFLECIWLKAILEFRALGLPVEKILIVKEFIFNAEELTETLMGASKKDEIVKLVGPGMSQKMQSVNQKDLLKSIKDIQLSYLHLLVIAALLQKQGFAICITRNEQLYLMPLGKITQEIKGHEVFKGQQEILSGSFVMVNIWPLILDLLYLDGIKMPPSLTTQILSAEEHQILLAIRSGNYREILIKIDGDGEPTHIKLKKEGIDPEALRKLYPYLKKGKYDHIEFVTRDGQLINYEETRIIKFKRSNKK